MTYISSDLRRLVIERANSCCEYCLLSANDSYLPHEIDHIISEKHGGSTNADNLCFSCFDCNRYKGSDIGSLDKETNSFRSFFNPRQMSWEDHFTLNGAVIKPLTPEGRVTVTLLKLNSDEQIAKRLELIELHSYPCHS
jgi:hypothetical protein